MSCPSLDGDNDAEVLTKAGDIKQDGTTNLALSVPFQGDGGSDSGAASILFVNILFHHFDILIVFIIRHVCDDIMKSDDHFGSAITTEGDLNNRRAIDLSIGTPLMKAVV